MALHIEAAANDAKKAKKGLARLYSSTARAFPLGIRMRLVSEFREVKGNPIMMGKHMRLRVRQASFISLIAGHTNDDIMLLDHKINGQSLRDMIMEIKSFNKETPGSLFHAVSQDWKGRYVFNFLESKTAEAAMIVDGLIPYLVHHYGKDVYPFFDNEALADKEDWTWDTTTNTVVNPCSKELDRLEAIDGDYDLSAANPVASASKEKGAGITTVGINTTAAALASTKLNMVLTGQDTDSVSTLGNPLSPARITKTTDTSLIDMGDTTSTSSVTSLSSLDTRVSTMEATINSMKEDVVAGVDAKLDAFFTKFLAAQSAPQPPGGESAGQSNE